MAAFNPLSFKMRKMRFEEHRYEHTLTPSDLDLEFPDCQLWTKWDWRQYISSKKLHGSFVRYSCGLRESPPPNTTDDTQGRMVGVARNGINTTRTEFRHSDTVYSSSRSKWEIGTRSL
jgi:hypothetical protein